MALLYSPIFWLLCLGSAAQDRWWLLHMVLAVLEVLHYPNRVQRSLADQPA